MVKAKQPVTRWHDGTTPIEELAPIDQLAHQIVVDFKDLTPSVARIMDAELDDDQRLGALTAFRNSLDNAGDPNRDPRVAITNATHS
jgi:hypothetical protein